MKITHLANHVGGKKGGGISVIIKDYFKNDKFLNYNLWFLGSNDYRAELEPYKNLNNRVRLISFIGLSRNVKINLPNLLYRLRFVNIVHQHGLWMPVSLISLYVSRILKKTVVIQPHGTLADEALKRSSLKKKITMFLFESKNLKNARVIIAGSALELNDIKKKFPQKEVALIPHGVTKYFIAKKSNIYDQVINKLADGRDIFLFVSRIHPIKGLERLIESVVLIDKEKLVNSVFVLAGDGEKEYVDRLKKMIKDNKVEDYFIFLGYLNEEQKISVIDKSKYFVLPSLSENFSISIVESLSRGVPVITTKGTPWSDIEKNKCGFWVDNSLEGLVDGINKALQLTDIEYSNFRNNAIQLVESEYLLEDNIEKLNQLYDYIGTNMNKPSFLF